VILLDPGPEPRLPGEAVDAVIRMPASEGLILARLRSVLRLRDLEEELAMRASTCRNLGMAEPAQSFARQSRVLLVPRRLEDGIAMADALSFEMAARIAILPRDQLLARLESRGTPDVLVIETDPADPARDLRLLSDLRCRSETRGAAIIMTFPPDAETEAAMALDLGASDVTIGPTGAAMLAAMMRHHLARAERLSTFRAQVTDGLRLAVLDPLTGLYNRRYALSHVARLATRAVETGRALALMVLDIDRFKQVNDTYGHQNGDRVIAAVAERLAGTLRGNDLVARIGGEEFLVVMPDTSTQDARRAAQRLRRSIASMEIPLDGGARVSVTLSIGLKVGIPEPGPEGRVVAALFAEADRALFAAKAGGRNHVTVARTAA
jgi:two-component system cell cycle response regulator